MLANLENSAVATGLKKVSFHSNPIRAMPKNYCTIVLILFSIRIPSLLYLLCAKVVLISLPLTQQLKAEKKGIIQVICPHVFHSLNQRTKSSAKAQRQSSI